MDNIAAFSDINQKRINISSFSFLYITKFWLFDKIQNIPTIFAHAGSRDLKYGKYLCLLQSGEKKKKEGKKAAQNCFHISLILSKIAPNNINSNYYMIY